MATKKTKVIFEAVEKSEVSPVSVEDIKTAIKLLQDHNFIVADAYGRQLEKIKG